jgi:hypothetical protein
MYSTTKPSIYNKMQVDEESDIEKGRAERYHVKRRIRKRLW